MDQPEPTRSPSQDEKEDSQEDELGTSPKRQKSSPSTAAAGKRGRPRKEDDPNTIAAESSSTLSLSEGQKRKEQNRAAQRAFRERKEKHVRELESHNAALTATVENLSLDNSNLKDLLARLQKENVQLRQTALSCTCSISPPITSNTTTMMSSVRSSDFHKIGAPDGFLA